MASIARFLSLSLLIVGLAVLMPACGDEETPAPTTPTPPPAPPPAPEPTPEPTGPATPENLRVTGMTSTSITWSWNAVEGVLGYQGQFSPDATFTAADATFLIVAPATSHTVSNLSGDTTGHFRVRSGTGTSLTDLTFSEWSDGVSGSTAAAPAPAPLAAPTGVEASGPTGTTINVSWDDVDDAGSYEVQRQPADGAWGAASCGGGGGTVTTATCVASGLTRGTSYAFRVRAHPDPDDTTRQVSGWSSTETARTTGTPPAPPVSGGDDAYDITWESNDTSITWTWSRPDDGRIRFLTTVVTPAADTRPACPAITAVDNNNLVWSGGTDGFATYSHTVSVLTAGAVSRLCVVPTWKDANGTPQYGTVFSAWAATSPEVGVDTHSIGLGSENDDDRRTTAINWYVKVDRGFTYEVQTISATFGDDLPSSRCGSGSGNTRLTSREDDDDQRFSLSSGLRTYTKYAACVRATNDEGTSDWTKLTEYSTLPGAPPAARYVGVKTSAAGAGIPAADVKGRFTLGSRLPGDPGSYTAKFLVWIKTTTRRDDNGTTDTSSDDFDVTTLVSAVKPDQEKCDLTASNTDYTVISSASIKEEGGSFLVTGNAGISRLNLTSSEDGSVLATDQSRTVYMCVRARLPDDTNGTGTKVDGPWSVGSQTITLKGS